MKLLKVVGIGPGDAAHMTPAARSVLEEAQVVVGYGGYVDMVPLELRRDKRVESTGMGGEMARCRTAIDLALEGLRVAVVSGGDAGVYGMAGLVLELAESLPETADLEVEVVPGVPALAAAAALLGAPLVNDFAVVSLSDLLTPWEVIERRLRCAVEGDFVLALYNPRSRRRDGHLARAVEIIAEVREASTPVGLVRQAFRQGQEVSITPLGEFDPETADMLSIVIVGNSTTRLARGRMFTPRGYMDKYGQ